MSRIEKCNEELKDGVSSVEFFNQHIKHLLLDEQKFKNQSSEIDNLHADMTEVKTQINLLMEHMTKSPEVNSRHFQLKKNLILRIRCQSYQLKSPNWRLI